MQQGQFDFLNEQVFAFREVLELLSLERGAVEGYVDRGIFSPQYPASRGGSPTRRTWTGRDILKLEAISSLTKLGVAPADIKFLVAPRAHVDRAITEFQVRGATDAPFVIWVPKVEHEPFDDELSMRMRKRGVYAYMVFDPSSMIQRWVPRLRQHLNERESNESVAN
jgi:hypothetical protein